MGQHSEMSVLFCTAAKKEPALVNNNENTSGAAGGNAAGRAEAGAEPIGIVEEKRGKPCWCSAA
jgi:hypothetical protein